MTIFIDSAIPEEVCEAVELGFVESVTTNPVLLAAAGRPATEVIPELCAIAPGRVFYQLSASTLQERRREGEAMLALVPGRVGLKVPATTENMRLVAEFSRADPVAVTAIFSGAQAIAACAAGAGYLLPYVNRSTRLLGDGPGLVRMLRLVATESGRDVRILAASIKSPAEAVDALLAGAHDLSLPLTVLRELGDHQLSRDAIAEFDRASRGGT